jgi:chromosome segregation ATPase
VHETELGITDDLLEALKNDKKEVEEEIERVQQTISTLRRSLDDVWSESRDCEYELVSVFMHRGKCESTRSSHSGQRLTFPQARPVGRDIIGPIRLIYRITVRLQ